MDTLLERCRAFFAERGIDAHLVGGFVRDEALGRAVHDYDFAVPSGALALARRLADRLGGAYVTLDGERETGRVVMPGGTVVDIALIRGDSIEADLAARDFTINAMARGIAPGAPLIDPHAGMADLNTRTIRAVSDAVFQSDPARIMRALRLAATLDFRIEPHTYGLLLAARPLLANVSRERVRDELVKALALPRSADALRAVAAAGLAPALATGWRIDEVTLARMARLEAYAARPDADASVAAELAEPLSSERPRLIVAKLALLFADASAAARDLAELRFAAHEASYAAALVRHAARFAAVPADAAPLNAHRFFRDCGPAALTLLAIALADNDHPERWPIARQFLDWRRTAYAQIIAPRPLLNGAELAARFGLAGPQIGAAVMQLVEAQVAGRVSTPDDAAAYMENALRASS